VKKIWQYLSGKPSQAGQDVSRRALFGALVSARAPSVFDPNDDAQISPERR